MSQMQIIRLCSFLGYIIVLAQAFVKSATEEEYDIAPGTAEPQDDNPFERNQAIEFSWDNFAMQASLGMVTPKNSLQKRGGTFGPAIVIPSCLGCAGKAADESTLCGLIENLFPGLLDTGNLERRATEDREQNADQCRLIGEAIPVWESWSYPPAGQLKVRRGWNFGFYDNDWRTQQRCKYWGLVRTDTAQRLNGRNRLYASEHILELNSIVLFFNEFALHGGPVQCKAINQMLFSGQSQDVWPIYRVMGLFPHAGNIPGWPDIKDTYLSEMPLLESHMNTVKMHMWQRITLNAEVDFTNVTRNGADHMEALREIALIWQYLNVKRVADSLINQWKRISDVFHELEQNTRPLATTGLTAAWTDWMVYQLNQMSTNTESYVQDALNKIAANEQRFPSDEFTSIIDDQRNNGLLRQSQMKFFRINEIRR
ncbi:hypothetical protein TWF696_008247 [Orbilia brochopaga]|uniref:Uncharacterized protein n=1 Tax=Orbilia brochopaga TaxID=3140254 RepID=A0AAV9UG54_9PEZI